MFGLYLQLFIGRPMSYLRYLCFFLRVVVSNTSCFCFLCLRLMYTMLPVSLDWPFLIAPSVFSNIYIEVRISNWLIINVWLTDAEVYKRVDSLSEYTVQIEYSCSYCLWVFFNYKLPGIMCSKACFSSRKNAFETVLLKKYNIYQTEICVIVHNIPYFRLLAYDMYWRINK